MATGLLFFRSVFSISLILGASTNLRANVFDSLGFNRVEVGVFHCSTPFHAVSASALLWIIHSWKPSNVILLGVGSSSKGL
ncbi:hypothetical protein D3C81_1028470 [compost metagenome]